MGVAKDVDARVHRVWTCLGPWTWLTMDVNVGNGCGHE